MKQQIKTLLAISTVALATTFTACSGKKEADEAGKTAGDKREVQLVKVMALKPQTISRTQSYSAILEANEEVHLVPNVPGKIKRIPVEVGTRVSVGQVLVEMDQTNLLQAKIQLANLQTEFNRMKILLESGSVSQQAYDQVKAQYDVSKTNVENLEQNTFIRAPFAGVVSGKYFEAGEMYSGSPIASVGKAAIVSLVQINPLKTFISVPEKYYPNVKENQKVAVSSDIYPDNNLTGHIVRVYPTIDATTHSFQVEIQVPNAGEKLKPGMYCRATLDLGQAEVIVVPSQAILKTQGSNERYVFINENNVAKRIVVEIGQRFEDQVEIISSEIKVGDQLIIAGQGRIINGDSLKIEK
jgi:RND family efflux transporter MFP subunit